MSLARYLISEMDKFYYFIIMPAESNNILARQSLFNKFSANIINSGNFLQIVAYLPSTFNEYFDEWPMNVNNYETDSKCEIIYIFDYTINEDDLEYFSKSSLGCIFVHDDVDRGIFDKIIEVAKMPIVSSNKKNSKIIPLTDNTVKRIYSAWNKNINKAIKKSNTEEKTKIPSRTTKLNKSGLKGIYNETAQFLNPINMCIDKLRGLQVGMGANLYLTEEANELNKEYKEKKADKLLINSLKRLICEKYLILILGYIKEESFDENDALLLSKFGIDKSMLVDLLACQSTTMYEEISTKIIDDFDNMAFQTDMVICIPSINYNELIEYNELFGKNKFQQQLLKEICDSNAYYEIIGYSDRAIIDKNYNRTKAMLVKERGLEKRILSLMCTLYALPRKLPYIRTRNIPSYLLYRRFFSDIQSSYMKYDICEMNLAINKVNKILLKSCHSEVWSIIDKHSHHIKLISDMPAEWIKINKVPLCMSNGVSRIPITPGNGLIGHSYLSRKYEVNTTNLNIMIISALSDSDEDKEISKYAKILEGLINEQLIKISKRCLYKEITTKKEFIKAIILKQPTILIYYGHGTWDNNDKLGYLLIGDEKISSIELESMNPKPLITILGACETEVNYGSHLNVGNLLIGSGCPAVIGTHLPIRANHAVSFISELIRNLVLCFTKYSKTLIYSWDEIILKTYQSHYILDVIISLEDLTRHNLDHLRYKYIDYCQTKNIKGLDIIKLRDYIFKEILSDESELYDMYLKLLENNAVLPLSLLYVSLGSPEKIIISNKNVEA